MNLLKSIFHSLSRSRKPLRKRESLGEIAHFEKWVTSKSMTSKNCLFDEPKSHGFRFDPFSKVAFFEKADFSKWSISKSPIFRSDPLFKITLFSRWAISRKERFENNLFFPKLSISRWLIFRSNRFFEVSNTLSNNLFNVTYFQSYRFRGDSFFEVTPFLGHFLGHSLCHIGYTTLI